MARWVFVVKCRACGHELHASRMIRHGVCPSCGTNSRWIYRCRKLLRCKAPGCSEPARVSGLCRAHEVEEIVRKRKLAKTGGIE